MLISACFLLGVGVKKSLNKFAKLKKKLYLCAWIIPTARIQKK